MAKVERSRFENFQFILFLRLSESKKKTVEKMKKFSTSHHFEKNEDKKKSVASNDNYILVDYLFTLNFIFQIIRFGNIASTMEGKFFFQSLRQRVYL